MSHNIEFGLTIPQGWRRGDFPLGQENNPVIQYEFAKCVATAEDNLNFNSIYAYDHLVQHYKDDTQKNIFECFTLIVLFSSNYKKSKDRTNCCMQFLSQSIIVSKNAFYIGYCK